MKRLLLLTTLILTLLALAPASQAEPNYCDGGGGFALIQDAAACGDTGGGWVQLGPCTFVPTWYGNFMWAYHPAYGHAWLGC